MYAERGDGDSMHVAVCCQGEQERICRGSASWEEWCADLTGGGVAEGGEDGGEGGVDLVPGRAGGEGEEAEALATDVDGAAPVDDAAVEDVHGRVEAPRLDQGVGLDAEETGVDAGGVGVARVASGDEGEGLEGGVGGPEEDVGLAQAREGGDADLWRSRVVRVAQRVVGVQPDEHVEWW